ncbi:MAG: hypothetical protein U5O39_18220 [Gammaproteobacteria bacterium]|nr:hypothetical protein [Gammaproteobacteria bacterium]
MFVADSRGAGSISFDADSASESALGHIVENRAILRALVETLEASAVTLMDECKIDRIEPGEQGYELQLGNGDVIRSRLLVGADGGNSIVRQACGIRSVSWRYPQEAVVTTIQRNRHTGRQLRSGLPPRDRWLSCHCPATTTGSARSSGRVRPQIG